MKISPLSIFLSLACGLVEASPVKVDDTEPVPDSRFTRCHECMPKECGRVLPNYLEYRLYGDRRVRHPWIVMLTDANKNGSFVGSGVLISCNLVVTSAYNVGSFSQISDIRARLGATNVNEQQDGEMEFTIRKTHVHPLWNSLRSLHAHDVAVLQLDAPVNFDEVNGNIAPICVPSSDRDYTGWLTVAGFGANLNDTNNGQLQEGDIFKYPKEDCQLFSAHSYAFCGEGNKKGFCNGDRGSPAVQIEADGRYSLAAIASDYQCWPGGLEVYTAAPDFADWLCTVQTV